MDKPMQIRQYSKLFENTDKQIEELYEKLQNQISVEVNQSLKEEITKKVNGYYNRLHSKLEEHNNQLRSRISQLEDPQAVKVLIEGYSSQKLLELTKEAIDIKNIKKDYQNFFNKTVRNSFLSSVLKRYTPSSSIVEAYYGGLIEPAEKVTQRLQRHHDLTKRTVKSYEKVVKEGNESFFYGLGSKLLVSSIVSGPIGFLGGILAGKFISNKVYNDKISSTLKPFLDNANDIVREIDNYFLVATKRVHLIYLTLYGGFLLKAQEDAKLFGYEINSYNWKENKLYFKVRSDQKKHIAKWVYKIFAEVAESVEKKEYNKAHVLSSYFYQFVQKNEPVRDLRIKRSYLKKKMVTRLESLSM